MKNKKITIFLIILLSIISIALIFFMFAMINGKFKFSHYILNYNISNELVIDNTYDSNFDKLKIDANASEIYIKVSHSEKTKVVIYGDKDNTSISTINNELKITSKEKKCIGFCFNFKVAKIEVYLPKDYHKLIDIKNDYGDIEVGDFANAILEIKENSGDVDIISGKEVTVENDYGDIKLRKADKAKINESSGDIEIGDVNYIEAKNNYGDIEISSVGKYLDITNNCGDIEVDNLDLTKNSYIKDDLGDIEIGHTNDIYIDAKTDLGDVKINRNYHKSDVTLKIQNDCGDIKVNN